MLPIRIRLLGGTLKIKRIVHMRRHELDGKVPVWQVGRLYFVWQRNSRARAS